MDFYEKSEQVINEIREVINKIEIDKINNLKNIINEHKRIFLMGVGREGLATRAFAMRLMHLGKEVHWCWDDTVPNVSADDLFIFTSGSGEIGHIDYVANRIKDIGATIVLVTGVPYRKTAKKADLVINIPAKVYNGDDNSVGSIQPMGNLFEQSIFLVFDLIIMEIVDCNSGYSYEKMTKRHRNFE